MTESIKVPVSVTDPYAPESSSFEPVRVLLLRNDGTETVFETDRRVMRRVETGKLSLTPLIRKDGVLYEFVGTDFRKGKWVRLFREAVVVEL